LPEDVSRLGGWRPARQVANVTKTKLPTRRITINLDADLVAVFKAEALGGGPPYQVAINQALRSYSGGESARGAGARRPSSSKRWTTRRCRRSFGRSAEAVAHRRGLPEQAAPLSVESGRSPAYHTSHSANPRHTSVPDSTSRPGIDAVSSRPPQT
jgi:uncharacterized protein (DUF4415 family)